ncbi:cyclic-phosphate processing receiver domain-containing protein [Paenibacillus marinisediminis]
MIHVYLDDRRRCPEGFVLAKNAEECLQLLELEEVDILSLDHDLGYGELTGTELVKEMVRRGLYAKRIYIHTSCLTGRQRMYEMLYTNKPEHVEIYNESLTTDALREACGSK